MWNWLSIARPSRTAPDRRFRIPYALLAGYFLLAGCAESVDPILGTEQAFTLYGFLDPTAARQAVRVFPIDGVLERYSEPFDIDAAVRSTVLASGDVRVWQDSSVYFRDFTYGHVFHAPFTPTFDTAYRLTVTRSDGAEAYVDVRTPPEVTPVRLASVLFPAPLLRVAYPGAPRLNEIVVRYTVDGVGPTGEPFDAPATYEFRHDGVQEETTDGWMVPIPFLEDVQALWFEYWADGRPFNATLALREVELVVLVSSADWYSPIDVYDADALVEPGVFSNVENGFGFVGAGYRLPLRWLPDAEVLAQVGLVPPP